MTCSVLLFCLIVFSGIFPYFPVFRRNTEIYSVNPRTQTKYGKIWARKISLFRHFQRSLNLWCNGFMKWVMTPRLEICPVRFLAGQPRKTQIKIKNILTCFHFICNQALQGSSGVVCDGFSVKPKIDADKWPVGPSKSITGLFLYVKQ